MARITVEDCLTKETNRFGLVLLAAKRAKQLLNGSKQVIEDNRGNKSVVTALREIADGQVRFMSEEEARLQKELDAQARSEERESTGGGAIPALRLGARVAPSTGDDEDGSDDESSSRNGSSTAPSF